MNDFLGVWEEEGNLEWVCSMSWFFCSSYVKNIVF